MENAGAIGGEGLGSYFEFAPFFCVPLHLNLAISRLCFGLCTVRVWTE